MIVFIKIWDSKIKKYKEVTDRDFLDELLYLSTANKYRFDGYSPSGIIYLSPIEE